jgi:hypothetical protein
MGPFPQIVLVTYPSETDRTDVEQLKGTGSLTDCIYRRTGFLRARNNQERQQYV